MAKKVAVGIDLGTTYSCVAVLQHGKIEVIANDQGNRTTPSYVAFADTRRLIGESAKNQVNLNPVNTIFDAKRLIGRKFDDATVQSDMKHWPFQVINIGGQPKLQVEYKNENKSFTPEEISSMVLTKMKETAEEYLGEKVTDAVITVPAYFNDSQRQATKDAGVIAGLNVMRIINEPTAAALAYGLDLKDRTYGSGFNVLIFDIGGGTFDVTIMNIKANCFEVKSTAGDTHLGGEDFDNRLVTYVAEQFKRKHKKDITGNKRSMRRLRTACEKAKRFLSSSPQADIEVDSLFEGIDFSISITRPRFEELCGDLFRSTLEPVEKALADAKLDKSSIQDVVLVGGSSRIPKIQKMLRDFFNDRELNKNINPDEAVAYGAAVQASILNGDKIGVGNNLILNDVTPFSLGVETIIEDLPHQMSVIIKRNTLIPTKQKGCFSTYFESQTRVNFPLYEGERVWASQNHFLGDLILDFSNPVPKGYSVDVTFEIDANGILTATAVDKSTGAQNQISIDKGRLPIHEINRMKSYAAVLKADDDKQKSRILAKRGFEDFCFNTKFFIDKNDMISEDSRKKINTKIDEAIKWLDKSQLAELGDYTDKKKELMTECNQIMAKGLST